MGMEKIAIANGTNLLLGRGALFLDRLTTAGAKQGYVPVGNCDAFELTWTTETREKRGLVDNTNPLLSRVEVARTGELSIKLSEFKPETMAMGLLGLEYTSFTQGNTPVVDKAITPTSLSKQGRVYFIGEQAGKGRQRQLTAVTIKVGAGTKTEGTDYEIDLVTGAVLIKVGGTITDNSTVTASYTPTTIAAGVISHLKPGTAGAIYTALRFVGNPMAGKVHDVYVPKVQILPENAMALIGEDYGTFDLKGTLVYDTTVAGEPYGNYQLV